MLLSAYLPPLLFYLSSSPTAVLVIPKPNGIYGVNVKAMQLTDTSRQDPFAQEPKYRSVMISAFYPAAIAGDCKPELTKYMPPATAAVVNAQFAPYGVPNGTLASLRLSMCQPDPAVTRSMRDFPVVLFSHGLGVDRLQYSVIAQSVASRGYVVVTIDHPYDSDVVEFPDHTIIRGLNLTPDMRAVDTRAKDASFVLDSLSKKAVVVKLMPTPNDGLDTSKVAMFGHSLGGAAVAAAMMNDHRIVGGINMDGLFVGPVIKTGLADPFILLARKQDASTISPTWPQIWPHLNWKLELMLANATHGTFTDLPPLAELLFGFPLPENIQAVIGSLEGKRAVEIITEYCVALFDEVLKCNPRALLQRPSTAYPEITFTTPNGTGY